jgi:hypothetical protein
MADLAVEGAGGDFHEGEKAFTKFPNFTKLTKLRQEVGWKAKAQFSHLVIWLIWKFGKCFSAFKVVTLLPPAVRG